MSVSAIVNLLNTILGTGLLAMPFAIASLGLAKGLLLLLLASVGASTGLSLLARSAALLQSGKASFFALASAPPSWPAAAIAMLPHRFALRPPLIAHILVVGDLASDLYKSYIPAPAPSWPSYPAFWVSLAIPCILPVTLLRQIDSLKYTSALALAALVYLLVLMLVYAATWPPGMPSTGRTTWSQIEWWRATPLDTLARVTPLLVFAFTCHQNIFSICNETRMRGVRLVVRVSIATAAAVYVYTVLVAAVSFPPAALRHAANVVLLYPPAPPVAFAQGCIALLVVLSYPLQVHPCRQSLEKVVQALLMPKRGAGLPVYADSRMLSRHGDGDDSTVRGDANDSTGHGASDNSTGHGDVDNTPNNGPSDNFTNNRASDDTPNSRASDDLPIPRHPRRPSVEADSTTPLLGSSNGGGDPIPETDGGAHVWLTLFIVTTGWFVAVTVDDLSRILSLVGATGSTTICYILPGLLYWKCTALDDGADASLSHWERGLRVVGLARSDSLNSKMINLVSRWELTRKPKRSEELGETKAAA
ncbi:MAG: hypothetical protein SGCHY_002107 [Lobulomycetales sp.]